MFIKSKWGQIGFLLGTTTNKMKGRLNNLFKDKNYDITVEQWQVLIYLNFNPGSNQQEIANTLYRDKQSIGKIVDKLEKKEFIERNTDINDRRNKKIFLSPLGQKLIPELKKIAMSNIKLAFDGVTQEELKTFKTVLTKIKNNTE